MTSVYPFNLSRRVGIRDPTGRIVFLSSVFCFQLNSKLYRPKLINL